MCSGLRGISAEKADVRKAVSLRVDLSIFYSFRHDLGSRYSTELLGEKHADGACSAVQLQHRVRLPSAGILHSLHVKLFRLHGIDLIKCLRGDHEFISAEIVRQVGISEKRIIVPAENRIPLFPVDAQHNTCQLRAEIPQFVDQRLGKGAKSARGNNAGYGIFRVDCRTAEDIAYGSGSVLLMVRADSVPVHEITDRPGDLLPQRHLDQTVLDRHKLMGALPEKAEAGLPVDLGNVEDSFVPVAKRIFTADDLFCLHCLPPDVLQRIVHFCQFEAQLLFIAHLPG